MRLLKEMARNLVEDFEDLKAAKQQSTGVLSAIKEELAEKESTLASLSHKSDLLTKATKFLQECSEEIRIGTVRKIEKIVTLALRAITAQEYTFIIDLHQNRNQWEAEFFIKKASGLTVKLKGGSGGGIENIVGFALQISVLEMLSEQIKTPLRLDEPFSNLSLEYEDCTARTLDFLKQVSQQLNRQIIMVTHNPNFNEIGDACYEITQKNDVASTKKLI